MWPITDSGFGLPFYSGLSLAGRSCGTVQLLFSAVHHVPPEKPRFKGNVQHASFLASLLGAPGLTIRSKDATRGSWPHY